MRLWINTWKLWNSISCTPAPSSLENHLYALRDVQFLTSMDVIGLLLSLALLLNERRNKDLWQAARPI